MRDVFKVVSVHAVLSSGQAQFNDALRWDGCDAVAAVDDHRGAEGLARRRAVSGGRVVVAAHVHKHGVVAVVNVDNTEVDCVEKGIGESSR